MKRLFLAASIDKTGLAITKDIIKITRKKVRDLRVAFINTAAEGSVTVDKSWLNEDREGLAKAGLTLFDYTITGKDVGQIDKDLRIYDVIHVNGGNTFYLMLQVRKSGFDKWIKNQVLRGGKIYIGSSAGSQIVAPNIEILSKPDTKIYEKELKTFEGIGLVDFVIFPHWGSDKFRDTYFNHRLKISYKPENKIILLNNWQYVRVEEDMFRIEEVKK